MSALALISSPDVLARATAAALSNLAPSSRRVYGMRIRAWQTWREAQANPPPLNRESTLAWLRTLEHTTGAASYNQALAALKRLATEAAEQAWIDRTTALQIERIHARTIRGHKTGMWLMKEQASALLAAPSGRYSTRDKAILALMLGCGLRRSEICALTTSHLVRLPTARTMIENLTGKGGRTRSILVPAWAEDRVRACAPPYKISTTAIYDLVQKYGEAIGVYGLAPHDLRRTMARLSRLGGAPLETVQCTLGHASVKTTEIYVRSGEEANGGDYFAL